MKALSQVIVTVALATCCATVGLAAEPMGTAFTYQGQLKKDGVPVNAHPPGQGCDFEFSLWDDSVGGNPLGVAQTILDQDVTNGLFTATLNDGEQFGPNAFNGDRRWLEIQVSCPAGSPFVPLGRQELTAVPYALSATAGGGDSIWELAGSNIYYNAGNVGIGTTGPTEKLDVNGTIKVRSAQGGGDWRLRSSSIGDFLLLDGGSDSFPIIVKNGAPTDSLRIAGNGNVGIGTTSTDEKLHVAGNLRLSGTSARITHGSDDMFGIFGNTTSGNSRSWIELWGNDPSRAGELALAGTYFTLRTNSTTSTSGVERMRVDVNGNVGIGTTDPGAKLHIQADQNVSGYVRLSGFDNDDTWTRPVITLERARGSATTPAIVQNGDSMGSIVARAFDGDQFHTPASIEFRVDGTPGNDDMPGRIDFYTTPNYDLPDVGAKDRALRMRIRHNSTVDFLGGDAGEEQVRVSIQPFEGEAAGTIKVYNLSGDIGGELDAHTGNGGELNLRSADGVNTVYVRAAETAEQGADFGLRDAAGTTTVDIDGDQPIDVGGGVLHHSAAIDLYRTVPDALEPTGERRTLTVHLRAAEGNGGAELQLRNASGTTTVEIDAHGGSQEGFMHLKGSDGTTTINLNGGTGRGIVNVLEIRGGSDLSEQFEINTRDAEGEPGTVVCIDPANPGKLVVCDHAYDSTVAGIISGAGGVNPGMLMGQHGSVADGEHPVALTGRVYVQASACNGSIRPGDLLTTSDSPGHAMKVTDHSRAQGAVLGKAMTALTDGTDLVLVLVSLQ